jgi:hypothetical protein
MPFQISVVATLACLTVFRAAWLTPQALVPEVECNMAEIVRDFYDELAGDQWRL